jgi:5-hydroxyisourate hydrolase-like protein (transthyretin family)
MLTVIDGGLIELSADVEKHWLISVARKNGESLEVNSVRVVVSHYENGQLREDLSSAMNRKENNIFEFVWTPKITQTYNVIIAADVQALRTSDVVISNANPSQFFEISGTVSDTRKNVVRDAYVVVRDETTQIIAEVQTDEQGRWIVWLRTGKYSLTFAKSGYATQETKVNVSRDFQNDVTLESLTLGAGSGAHSIKGKTEVGSIVRLHLKDRLEEVIAQAQTNDQGIWELFVDTGEYIVELKSRFQQISVDEKGQSFWGDVLDSKVESGVKIGGTGDITVNGVIQDEAGIAVSNARVRVYRRGTKGEVAIAESSSDVDGRWTVRLEPGPYAFEFGGEGLLSRIIDASITGIRTVENFDEIMQRY